LRFAAAAGNRSSENRSPTALSGLRRRYSLRDRHVRHGAGRIFRRRGRRAGGAPRRFT